MDKRQREYRRAAAECLEVAATTTDPVLRAELIEQAERWLVIAGEPLPQYLRTAALRAEGPPIVSGPSESAEPS